MHDIATASTWNSLPHVMDFSGFDSTSILNYLLAVVVGLTGVLIFVRVFGNSNSESANTETVNDNCNLPGLTFKKKQKK